MKKELEQTRGEFGELMTVLKKAEDTNQQNEQKLVSLNEKTNKNIFTL